MWVLWCDLSHMRIVFQPYKVSWGYPENSKLIWLSWSSFEFLDFFAHICVFGLLIRALINVNVENSVLTWNVKQKRSCPQQGSWDSIKKGVVCGRKKIVLGLKTISLENVLSTKDFFCWSLITDLFQTSEFHKSWKIVLQFLYTQSEIYAREIQFLLLKKISISSEIIC